MTTMTNNNAATNNDNDDGERHPTIDDEPDWNSIMLHEPARTEVPNFLAARSRLEGANERFAIDLDTFHESLKQSMGGLIDVVTLVLYQHHTTKKNHVIALSYVCMTYV